MSQASEEYINQSEVESLAGSITALPSPMSKAQYDYMIELLDTSILATVQKDDIHRLLQEGNLTQDHANRIILELQRLQNSPLNRVQNGELLLQTDLKIAIKQAADSPNT